MPGSWYVYILECQDKTLYTGITTDPLRRLAEHNSEKKAARYTRTRRPVKMVYTEECDDRSHASRREHAIKKLSRKTKLQLVSRADQSVLDGLTSVFTQ